MKKFIPKTLNDAIDYLYKNLSKEDIAFIRKHKDSSSVHFTSGMALRNDWGLWREDTPFKEDIKKRFKLFGHGDDCSGLILEGVWARVKGKDVDDILDHTAKRYHRHWKAVGVNPETGEETPGISDRKCSITIVIDKDGNIKDEE